jgi:rhodanese-related sulfurtransferase
MKPKQLIWAVIAVAAVAAVVFALSRPAGGGIRNVDAAGVKSAIAGGAQVIDVRTAGEFQMGHVAGAVNVPVDQLEQAAQSWDRDATYVVYCATGSRSATAVETMKALGFENIRHFAAGIQAWDGGLEQGGAASSQKVETAGKPVLIEFFTDA